MKAFVMLAAAVLAVIAVGVGIVAAATNTKVYGPSWGQFTAAFPGRVHQYRGNLSVPFEPSTPFIPFLVVKVPYFEYSTASSPWIAYSRLLLSPNELDAGVQRAVPGDDANRAIQQRVSDLKVFFTPGVAISVRDENGYSVTILGPFCASGQCRAAEVVSNGRVLWTMLAIAPGPQSKVEAFIASFQPIG